MNAPILLVIAAATLIVVLPVVGIGMVLLVAGIARLLREKQS